MRAVIYTRVSLDKGSDGRSNARQEEECQRLIDFKRWETIGTESDVSISAYGEKERPAWQRVLGMIEAGQVDVVVAYHLDRLTRNMADLEKLILLCEAHDVLVATATGDIDLTNDTGRMVARILAAVARQEVERKAARQKLAHAQRRAAGLPYRGVKMLGYTTDGEIIESEAKVIREAAEQVVSGQFSLAEIGRRWDEAGAHSAYRKDDTAKWSRAGVRGLLTNPRLAGFVVEDGVILGEGQWEPILDEHTFTLVSAKLSDSSRAVGGKTGRRPVNLLSNIMRCYRCDGPVHGGGKRGILTYVCHKGHVQTPRTEADELVRSSFAAAVAMSAPGAILKTSQSQPDAGAVEAEVTALRERQGVLARSFARGVTSEDAYESAVSEISERIKELESQTLAANIDWRGLRAESVRSFLQQSLEEQRRILTRLAVITIHPSGRKGMRARDQVEVLVRTKVGSKEKLVPAYVPETQKAPQPTG